MLPHTRVAIAGGMLIVHRDAAGRLVWRHTISNGVTVQGANYLLDAAFKNGTKAAIWYLGLIEGLTFSSNPDSDTHALHPGWQEYTQVGASRPLWNRLAAGSGAIGPSSPTVFNITASGYIRGAFAASRQPVGDVSAGGILYATAKSVSNLAVTAGGTVSVGYTVSGSAA